MNTLHDLTHKNIKRLYILIAMLILVIGGQLTITFGALGIIGDLQQRIEQLESLNGYAIDKDLTQ
jgi:hypothetical protein